MKKLIDYLQQLELSEIEAKLYVALLHSGPVNVRELAEAIGIKRTTAYLYIDQLIEKGLVVKIVRGAQKQVAVSDPRSLSDLVEKKTASARQIKKGFSDILKTIQVVMPEGENVEDAEIRYYKGKNGVKKIYEEALKANELRLYATLAELFKLAPLFPNAATLFEDALRDNKKLRIFEIYGDSPDIIKNYSYTTENKRFSYKFMPSSVGLTAPGILLYDNKVAIINIQGNIQDKLSAVVLNNADYYINSKKLFDFIWGLLPESHS